MSDAKLFRLLPGGVSELKSSSIAVEKSLQTLIESHLDIFLGVRFLASEYSTGKTHAGRIDTLGIDENGSPVIVEYKRALNENVINQGLFYLDWLLDHKAEFELLTMKKLGNDAAAQIDWNAPRLLCIAGDFMKYDEHAIKQINRGIELIRYRRYGDEFLFFELVNASVRDQSEPDADVKAPSAKKYSDKTVQERLDQAPDELRNLFEALSAFLHALGGDVIMTATKGYFAFRRLKNFACVEVYPNPMRMLIYVKVNPDSVTLEKGFTRDVRMIGHWGTGDLEITVNSTDDLERAKAMIQRSYEAS